jgi:hypothetical protein
MNGKAAAARITPVGVALFSLYRWMAMHQGVDRNIQSRDGTDLLEYFYFSTFF